MKVRAIDPPGCGCTECIIGEYVPLDRATPKQVARMLRGKIANNLSSSTTIVLSWSWVGSNAAIDWACKPPYAKGMHALIDVHDACYSFDITKWWHQIIRGK